MTKGVEGMEFGEDISERNRNIRLVCWIEAFWPVQTITELWDAG